MYEYKYIVMKKGVFVWGEKFFTNVIANIILVLTIVGVLGVAVKDEIAEVFNSSQPQAIYRGNTDNNNVSLMINVYWGTEYIPQMLDVMDKHGVKCTFFVGGSWAAKEGEMLKQIYERGHEIGNHGYYHKDHNKISKQRNYEEIKITEQIIEQTIGYKTNLFAPPSGSFSKDTLLVADELGYKTIMWSKDTIDWRDKDTQLIIKRATTKISNGELILMHPTYNTLQALDTIITTLKNNDFKLVTVSDNIEKRQVV